VPTLLAAEWPLEAELFDGEVLRGVVPVLFAENPAGAETTLHGDPANARKDVDRLQRSLFQPEILSTSDAIQVCKKPRSGEAAYAFKTANLDLLTSPSRPTGSGASSKAGPTPGGSGTSSKTGPTPGGSDSASSDSSTPEDPGTGPKGGAKKRRMDAGSSSGRDSWILKRNEHFIDTEQVFSNLEPLCHPPKYSTVSSDERIDSTLNCDENYSLIVAAYASSTWNGMMAAKSCFEKFEFETENKFNWPIPLDGMKKFVNWAILEKDMSAKTVKVYISNIATLHKLKNLDSSECKNFTIKTMLRGAENLSFYDENSLKQRNVMTLAVLRLFGHELSISDWSVHSVSVVWTAACTAFFGSFRLSELLSKEENRFNPFETLLWRDIIFLNDGSAKIHNKVPKTRIAGGETISIFKFDKFSCCPIGALLKLKKLSDTNENLPVFTFANGTFLTNDKLNATLRFFLGKRMGKQANGYSCQSFRGALPSALASNPAMGNDPTIKKWGRWHSAAFEKYTRLSHIAKKALFERFTKALEDFDEE
jgi:hypothetical protein